MKLENKIVICFNEPTRYYNNYIGKDFSDTKDDVDLSEREFLQQITNIKKILEKKYVSVETIAVNSDIKTCLKKIANSSPDVILNFVESVEGNSNLESYVAGLYDILEIPYTGNNMFCLGNCLSKSRTKQILQSYGIRTPKHFIANVNQIPKPEELSLKFPVISKLAKEDASIGISEFSVVNNYKALCKRLEYLYSIYNQDVIIEEYIEGRELNVAILGDKILPISEIRFDGLPDDLPKIITYEAKWSPESVYYKNTVPQCPAVLDGHVRERIIKMAKNAFDALECRDYARVDIRLNSKNIPYIIEVNPNPDISPDAGFIRSAGVAGTSYEEVLYKLTEMAINRRRYDSQALSDDREQLVKIVDSTNNFSDEEKKIAVELIDEAIANPNHEYYNVFVFVNNKEILGYHCVGKRALTEGVYDLYWIVVGPNAQNMGVGKKLLNHVEEFAKEKNGTWILAETSSKNSYDATRNFYFRNNYSIVAEIKDFYTAKDDLIVFGKYIK